MNTLPQVKEWLESLRALQNPVRADWDRAYHKSQREHWGIPSPDGTCLVKAWCKGRSEEEILAMAQALWDTDFFDPMICAAKMLSVREMKASSATWQKLLCFLQKVDGWALEDTLAHAAWQCITTDESLLEELEGWTVHPNFWMRRAALVYTLPFAKSGRHLERCLRWAASYASDKEWFIQKAIGWWLRVLGEKHPEQVVSFLEVHWTILKSVARREATRKLPLHWKERVLC